MNTYEIRYESVCIDSVWSETKVCPERNIILEYPKLIQVGTTFKDKFFIHYFENGNEVAKEFHSYNGINTDHVIRYGYVDATSPETLAIIESLRA